MFNDLTSCLKYPFISHNGQPSLSDLASAYLARNIKRLGWSLIALMVWWIPSDLGLKLMGPWLCVCFLVLQVSFLMLTQDNSSLKSSQHPSGISGLPFPGKLSSWLKNLHLAIFAALLLPYFYACYHGVIHAGVPVLRLQDLCYPLLVSGLFFSMIYILKMTQKIYDYGFRHKAWQMHVEPAFSILFNSQIKRYNPMIHVIRGLVEWVFCTTQLSIMVGSLAFAIAPFLCASKVFWMSNLLICSMVAIKLTQVSRKFSCLYFQKKLVLTGQYNFDPQDSRYSAKSNNILTNTGYVAAPIPQQPPTNWFYDRFLGYCETNSPPCVSAFCIIDSDDEEYGAFVEAPAPIMDS